METATFSKLQPSRSKTPNSLPPISSTGADDSQVSKRSGVVVNKCVGFLCCNDSMYHSWDPGVKTVITEKQIISKMKKEPLEPKYIISSLRFETQFLAAVNQILRLNGQELRHAFRSLITLSTVDQVSFIRSVLLFQKGKFAKVVHPKSFVTEPLTTDQRKWRFRCAAEVMSLYEASTKIAGLKHSHLQAKPLISNLFEVIHWFQCANGLERREFFCSLISLFDLTDLRVFSEVIAERQHRDFLLQLPKPLVKKILGYLSFATHGKLSMVNHAYYQLVDSMKSPADSFTVTRLIELENPMPNIPSFQKAFMEMRSRENLKMARTCSVTELEGHVGRILCVTIWRNYIASGGKDKAIRIWTTTNFRLLSTLTGHNAGVWCLKFFTKTILLSGSYDCSIRLWSIRRGYCLRELQAHQGPVWGLSVDGNVMLSGSQDRMAILWDAVRGEPLHRLIGHKEAVFAVDLCNVDAVAITGSADKTMKIWSTEDGSLLRSVLVGVELSVTAVSYSRGYIAAASANIIKIYRMLSFKPKPPPQSALEKQMDKKPEIKRIVNIFNHPVEFADEHYSRIETLSFRITNANPAQLDGVLVSGAKDGFFKYWDVSQKDSLQTFKPLNGAVVNCVYFDAYRIAIAGDNNKLRLYDFSTSLAALASEGFSKVQNKGSRSRNSIKSQRSTVFDQRSVTFTSETAE